MIELMDVVKRFGDLVAVDQVSLTIEKGEKIVVIGPSGSGKTTLLRIINFLEKMDAGKILLKGKEVGYVPIATRQELAGAASRPHDQGKAR